MTKRRWRRRRGKLIEANPIWKVLRFATYGKALVEGISHLIEAQLSLDVLNSIDPSWGD